MTHFIGAVVVPSTVHVGIDRKPSPYAGTLYAADALDTEAHPILNDYLNTALERFSENRSVERYKERDEIIKDAKRDRDYSVGPDSMYAQYKELGLKGYLEKYPRAKDNKAHMNWITGPEPEAYLALDDEGLYQKALSEEDPSDVVDGKIHETYNPDSKWDWWVIGGRWEETYRDRQGESVSKLIEMLEQVIEARSNPETMAELAKIEADVQAKEAEIRKRYYSETDDKKRKAIDQEWDELRKPLEQHPAYVGAKIPSQIVVPAPSNDGYDEYPFEWLEEGRNGWWGMFDPTSTPDEWYQLLLTTLKPFDPESKLVYIDFHI